MKTKQEAGTEGVTRRFQRDGGQSEAPTGDDRNANGASGAPDDPTDLEKPDYKAALKRAVKEAKEDDITDWAAALTYYGVLALFPGLLALVSVLGLFGQNAQPLIENFTSFAPAQVQDLVNQALSNLQSSGTANTVFFLGLAGAIWSASGYIGAFTRASNAIYEVDEGRPIWKLKPQQLGITVVLVAMLAVVLVAVVVSGPIAQAIGDVVGLGDQAVSIYNIVKWPIIALVIATMIAFLYYFGPNVKQPKFSWVSPGGILAVVAWIVASALFALYVANFGNYNKTYGALGGVIVFLVWLWISNLMILVGAELNAELERQRAIRAGHPPEVEPFLEPKQVKAADDPNTKKAKARS